MKTKNTYSLTAKIWRWRASSWHFITIPTEMFTEIREKYGKGMLAVEASAHGYSWKGSLFPHLQTESFLLSMTRAVRRATGLQEGDTIHVEFRVVPKDSKK